MSSSSSPSYELIYWPGLPGRGEHVRLALEEAGAAYADTARAGAPDPVLALIDPSHPGDARSAPVCAPPALRTPGGLVLSQTPNILLYLGDAFGGRLAPEGGDGRYVVHGLALTALDGLSNEVHDVHHPIATSLYYEDQKEEALRRSKDYLANRLPKFLGYFQRVLAGPASGDGPWLYGRKLSYADLVLFQCVDGVKFMFPNAMKKLETSGAYDRVFALHAAVAARPNIKAYLASDRRQAYGIGIYRHYPELDPAE